MTSPTPLTPAARDAIPSALSGDVLLPAHPEYDAARRVWNAMIDKRPAVIVRCHDVEDVRRAIAFARANAIPVAVRGGGHNAAGLAVCDGGVVIDLAPMHEVEVDPTFRVARAQGGATWGQFDAATQAHGLATTGGAVSTTGIAGLTLGGGLGWLMRSYGMACDNVLSAQVVTADGNVLTASPTENADLFWAIRGGGGNFGVVTSFDFKLYPVGPTILGGTLVHPIARARDALRFFRDFAGRAPDALTVFAGMLVHPEAGPIVAFPLCYNGPVAEGEEAIRELRAFGPPIVDGVAPIPYTAMQRLLDEGMPAGLNSYWRSHFVGRLDDAFLDTLVERFTAAPSPLSLMLIEQFGGAVSRVPRDENAFDNRDADYNLVMMARWTDPATAPENIAWVKGASDAVRPYTTGQVYVNYLGVEEDAGRIESAYGDKYARLAAIKRRYDPSNLFCSTHNIAPATSA
jgi:FAD/FMN-containing dehydrogenase